MLSHFHHWITPYHTIHHIYYVTSHHKKHRKDHSIYNKQNYYVTKCLVNPHILHAISKLLSHDILILVIRGNKYVIEIRVILMLKDRKRPVHTHYYTSTSISLPSLHNFDCNHCQVSNAPVFRKAHSIIHVHVPLILP